MNKQAVRLLLASGAVLYAIGSVIQFSYTIRDNPHHELLAEAQLFLAVSSLLYGSFFWLLVTQLPFQQAAVLLRRGLWLAGSAPIANGLAQLLLAIQLRHPPLPAGIAPALGQGYIHVLLMRTEPEFVAAIIGVVAGAVSAAGWWTWARSSRVDRVANVLFPGDLPGGSAA
jgi:hypothetical protein